MEGILLARYSYDPLKRQARGDARPRRSRCSPTPRSATRWSAGARRGLTLAGATMLARDLANTPPAHLTARGWPTSPSTLAAQAGLGVEVFNKDELIAAGLRRPARRQRGQRRPAAHGPLTLHAPAERRPGHLALVGKGIMYDSGGISLKPSDAHARAR